ncbi:MAG: glycosyltransferase family 4 protein [Candidatus Aminicenantes bacterium]|nr:glycosyltransferase family 4 protein [Candidatus Aminicenantes bacterium]
MKIAALLPHVEVFGGVRRYLELGNAFRRRGHEFVLFHPTGLKPDWLFFLGETRPLGSLEAERFDVGLCSEYALLDAFRRLRATDKHFYFVLAGHKEERRAARGPWRFLANSEGLCRRLRRRYGIECFKAAGGVDPDLFRPFSSSEARTEGEIRVLTYGRIYKRRKGVRQVVKALDGLSLRHPGLKLILFDTLVGHDRRDPRPMLRTRLRHEFHLNLSQERLARLYSEADIYVSAERRAGWSNTTAEAMACRTAVVCTPSGTEDFAFDGRTALVAPLPLPFLIRRRVERLIRDPDLRSRLAEAGWKTVRQFTWAALAERLEGHFRSGPN